MSEEAIIAKIREYLDAGKTETEMLNALKEDLGEVITFMELKLYLADIDEIVEKENEGLDDLNAEKAKLSEEFDQERDRVDEIQVDIDAIPKAGARLSGCITMPEGGTINWAVNSQGQLGILPGGTHDPSQEEMGEISRALQDAIQKKMGLL